MLHIFPVLLFFSSRIQSRTHIAFSCHIFIISYMCFSPPVSFYVLFLLYNMSFSLLPGKPLTLYDWSQIAFFPTDFSLLPWQSSIVEESGLKSVKMPSGIQKRCCFSLIHALPHFQVSQNLYHFNFLEIYIRIPFHNILDDFDNGSWWHYWCLTQDSWGYLLTAAAGAAKGSTFCNLTY